MHVDCVSGNGKVKHIEAATKKDAEAFAADYRKRTGNGGWTVRVYHADTCPFCAPVQHSARPRRIA